MNYVYVVMVERQLARVFGSFDTALAWVKSYGVVEEACLAAQLKGSDIWIGSLAENCELGSAFDSVGIHPEKVYS